MAVLPSFIAEIKKLEPDIYLFDADDMFLLAPDQQSLVCEFFRCPGKPVMQTFDNRSITRPPALVARQAKSPANLTVLSQLKSKILKPIFVLLVGSAAKLRPKEIRLGSAVQTTEFQELQQDLKRLYVRGPRSVK